MPLSQSLQSPVLIGRQALIDQLIQFTQQARRGAGRAVILTGEAGIGKSRLVAEVSRHAREGGFLVLQANCYEQDRALPYAPFLDLHNSLTRQALDSAAGPDVKHGAGALAEIIVSLTTPDPVGLTAAPEGQAHPRRRRQEALAAVLLNLASDQPVLLAFEDLHWADDDTLALLQLLTRRLQDRPVILILTYRAEEAPEAVARLLLAHLAKFPVSPQGT